MTTTKFETALRLIDEAHSQDPTLISIPDDNSNDTGSTNKNQIPYELYYATQTTKYLHFLVTVRNTDTTTTTTTTTTIPETLQLAIRAQHIRRWEVPRNSYPMTKPGYHAWRTYLAKRQGEITEEICLRAGYSETEARRVGGLVRKEGLSKKKPDNNDNGGHFGSDSDSEMQMLEDVACLVFLGERLGEFAREYDEEKLIGILRKTWVKMSPSAQRIALGLEMEEGVRGLVEKAVGGH